MDGKVFNERHGTDRRNTMLRSLHHIKDYKLKARDDEFGRVLDFLIDDEYWTVRYMVANTGRWLPGRKVLISPVSLKEPDWESREFAITMTREQIEDAPALETDAPVSRKYEMDWHDTVGYPYYWGFSYPWAYGPTPWDLMKADQVRGNSIDRDIGEGESALRSVEEVRHYRVSASDGDIGHVDDFIMDDETWAVRYMVVDSRNWLPGQKVLVAPDWLGTIDWASSSIETTLSCEAIKASPAYDPSAPINRDYEQRLFDYYGRPAYW
jgi:hypothetical protein